MNIRIALLGAPATPGSASAAVDPVADRPSLDPVALALTASAPPTGWAWRVNGATAGLDAATSATPTFTPPWPGVYTVTCTATISGRTVEAEPATFIVGDGSRPLDAGPAIPAAIQP